MFDDDPRTSPIERGDGARGSALDRVLERSNADDGDQNKSRTRHDLDSPAMVDLHARLLGHFEREISRQTENRAEMAIDEEFYDNNQWAEEDAAVLKARGQVPLVYNVLSTAVNWITGSEKRGRTDYKILPRRADALDAARRKTQVFKYLSDVNRSPFHRSRAFEDAVRVGVGWMECGVRDEDDGEPIYDRYESWRNILWDSASTEKDLSDCRYVFRTKWVDLDVAQALFPDRAGALRESAVDGALHRAGSDRLHGDEAMDAAEESLGGDLPVGSSGDASRLRARLIECWFRRPVPAKRLRGGQFSGELYDPFATGHAEEIEAGVASVVEKVMMRTHVAIMTTKALLHLGESPYRHNEFPFTPIWCYRRGRDGMPYGVVRGLRDIQRDINKRASKALHILSTSKTVMDEGAVDDIDKFLDEVSRPDAVIVKKQGKELAINVDRDLAPAHLELMSRSIQMVQQVSGVTDEAMGRTTNAVSGVAVQSRQQQAGMATAGLFDNLRLAAQVHGEKMLSAIEQFMDREKAFRITDTRGAPEFVRINDGLPDNDITRSKADFIISEDDWRASVRQSQVAELLDLLTKLAPVAPQAAVICLDLLVESMDIGNRDELVKRIRKITGERDPAAGEPTPEEHARLAQQDEQARLAAAQAQADLADKQAGAALKTAQAKRMAAEVERVLAQTSGDNVSAQKAALKAALMALANPGTARVGDLILHESGFRSRSENEADQRASAILEGEAKRRLIAEAAAKAPPPPGPATPDTPS